MPNIIGGQKQAYRTARSMVAVPEVASVPTNLAGDPLSVYMKARAVKETFNAKKAQLEYELLAGKLIDKNIPRESAAALLQMVKEHVLAQPDRLASTLAAISDTPSAHKVLSNDGKALLVRLSKAVADSGF